MRKRIRTITKCAEEIKSVDPQTAINPHVIRVAIREGKIPYKKSGKKFLITIEDVLHYFCGEDETKERKNHATFNK